MNDMTGKFLVRESQTFNPRLLPTTPVHLTLPRAVIRDGKPTREEYKLFFRREPYYHVQTERERMVNHLFQRMREELGLSEVQIFQTVTGRGIPRGFLHNVGTCPDVVLKFCRQALSRGKKLNETLLAEKENRKAIKEDKQVAIVLR